MCFDEHPGATMAKRQILQEIEARQDMLRRSERKVADLVLARPEDVIHMRIVDLAAAAEVSEPTVVRFCRAIDLQCERLLLLGLFLLFAAASSIQAQVLTVGPGGTHTTLYAAVRDADRHTEIRVAEGVLDEVFDPGHHAVALSALL